MRRFLSLLLTNCSAIVGGQNLVRNPGFEQTKYCAMEIGMFSAVVYDWSIPNFATTDLFSACAYEDSSVPANFQGSQRAQTGKNYAGFFLLADSDYREYVQGSLSETLAKGRRYRLGFYLNLSDLSMLAIKKVGVLFSEQRLKVNSQKNLSADLLQKNVKGRYVLHEIDSEDFLTDQKKWMHLVLDFTADGFENYFSIGNFDSNQQTQSLATRGTMARSYYYIDEVSIEAEEETRSKLQQGETYVLKKLVFAFDKFSLTLEARLELDELVAFLIENPTTKIEISGHTDTTGSQAYNLSMSEKRAKAVAGYLIENGIQAARISTSGFGDQKPIAPNATDQGRLLNRRVEFVIRPE